MFSRAGAIASNVAAMGAVGVVPIVAPVLLGSASANADASTAITTVADAPAGGLIVTIAAFVDAAAHNLANASTCADTVNTYSSPLDVQNGVNPTSRDSAFFEAFNSVHLGIGGTITCGPGSTGFSSQRGALALYASGLITTDPLDVHGNFGTGTGTAVASATSATLAKANELIVGYVITGLAASGVGFTEDATFTSIGSIIFGTSIMRVAYKIVAATTAVAYAPTFASSVNWGANVISFKGN